MSWCHNCNKEYTGGKTECPGCGAPLSPDPSGHAKASWSFGKKNKTVSVPWPADAEGNEAEPELLTNVQGSQLDYELVLSQLRSFGIPYRCDFPVAAQTAIFGFAPGGLDVYVPSDRLEEAEALLFGDDAEDDGELPEELRDAEDE